MSVVLAPPIAPTHSSISHSKAGARECLITPDRAAASNLSAHDAFTDFLSSFFCTCAAMHALLYMLYRHTNDDGDEHTG